MHRTYLWVSNRVFATPRSGTCRRSPTPSACPSHHCSLLISPRLPLVSVACPDPVPLIGPGAGNAGCWHFTINSRVQDLRPRRQEVKLGANHWSRRRRRLGQANGPGQAVMQPFRLARFSAPPFSRPRDLSRSQRVASDSLHTIVNEVATRRLNKGRHFRAPRRKIQQLAEAANPKKRSNGWSNDRQR